MNVGIAGYGYVGKAIAECMKNKNTVLISDHKFGHYDDLRNAQAIIVCVSTPRRSDGSCNMNNVFEVVQEAPDVPILIKSTISLEGWRMLKDTFPEKQLTFSPEFLRAETAVIDFANTKTVLLGGDSTHFWAGFFVELLGTITVKPADPEELILAKYARNSFLALKVSFFNQLEDLCNSAGVSSEQVRKFVAEDERIGHSHSNVTEKRGFGGHCFPKDVDALIHQAHGYNAEFTLLQEAVKYNKKIRNEN